MQALDEALTLLADPRVAYAQATPHTQRLLNQTLFTARSSSATRKSPGPSKRLGWQSLHRLAQTASQPTLGHQNGQQPQPRPRNGRGPQKGGRDLNDEEMVRLVGQLSNLSSSLEQVLSVPRPLQRRASIPAQPQTGRLGNGEVGRAVVKALEAAPDPMRGVEIHAAVERLLGCVVSKDSVSWSLAADVRSSKPRFERVSYGRYRLKS